MREVERQPQSWCPSRPPGGSPPGGDYDYDYDYDYDEDGKEGSDVINIFTFSV